MADSPTSTSTSAAAGVAVHPLREEGAVLANMSLDELLRSSILPTLKAWSQTRAGTVAPKLLQQLPVATQALQQAAMMEHHARG